MFWSTFANGQKQNYCFDISFQRVFTNINSTTDICTLCKRVSRFSVKIVLSHSTEKIRRGAFLWFGRSLVSKNVRDKRGGGYHDFPSKLFCLTVPKNFVGEPFGISEKIWYRKILCFRELFHDFPSNFFVSQCRKISEGNPSVLCFRKIPVAKFMDKRGGVSRFSIENFLSHKNFVVFH